LSTLKTGLLVGAATGLLAACVTIQNESGFTSLFDGQTLKGWTLIGKHGDGYGVKDGVIYCARGGGGNLYTEKEYADFVLRFEFKLEPGSNNGIGIRAPLEGDGAYVGMEIQVLEDSAPQYANLQPWQFHGSIYGVVPAKRGALRKIGEWNQEEIVAQGRQIKVTLNGKVIVDASLNNVTNAAVLRKHPGLLRDRGHIGFLGHNDYVEFRNLRIRELPVIPRDNVPPEGFTALFNGKDLSGWKGLLASPNDSPVKRAKLSPAERAAAQTTANQRMVEHWKAVNGVLEFDGKGDSLCTASDYGDFEMLVDWKIKEGGDSGIYLRGSPQVQIWDPFHARSGSEVGSGGLYNNQNKQKNPSDPLKRADHWIGDWNHFRILMVGEKVHVFLNGELVVNDVTLENYWDRSRPIFPTGQIELQNHGNNLYFKNIYIRELPRH
jgi:hypothetical protein